jgi:hypothetical protein
MKICSDRNMQMITYRIFLNDTKNWHLYRDGVFHIYYTRCTVIQSPAEKPDDLATHVSAEPSAWGCCPWAHLYCDSKAFQSPWSAGRQSIAPSLWRCISEATILSWLSGYFVSTSTFVGTTVPAVVGEKLERHSICREKKPPRKRARCYYSWEHRTSTSDCCQKSSAIGKQKCPCIKNACSYCVPNNA